MNSPIKGNLIYSAYYAPRGRRRLFMLANELSNRYLHPNDFVIGIIGAEGAGKSTLIKGLFPGLELTNDDEGVNIQPAPIYNFAPDDFFSSHTFHIDVRYELAFKQRFKIVEAISLALKHERRVVIEHFDLIYEALGYNAQILFAIGEEVIVARPTVFGPLPETLKHVVDKTIKYRFMAHSAEDITSYLLEHYYNYKANDLHSDVKHGFVINFKEKPEFDIRELESRVNDVIAEDLPIKMRDEQHIEIGEHEIYCTGGRIHVKSSGMIKNFRLVPEFQYDNMLGEYLLVGIVGEREIAGFEDIAPIVG